MHLPTGPAESSRARWQVRLARLVKLLKHEHPQQPIWKSQMWDLFTSTWTHHTVVDWRTAPVNATESTHVWCKINSCVLEKWPSNLEIYMWNCLTFIHLFVDRKIHLRLSLYIYESWYTFVKHGVCILFFFCKDKSDFICIILCIGSVTKP